MRKPIFCGRSEKPRLGWMLRWPQLFLFAILASVAGASPAFAQETPGGHPVQTIFVQPMSAGQTAEAVRARLTEKLKKSKSVRVVNDQGAADATLRYKLVLWSTGRVSPNPRSHSIVQTNYQGYLSAELIVGSSQTLWSYLATPERFHMSSVADDLADQISAKLLDALGTGIAAATGSATSNGGHTLSLRAAGATFPAPLYQKWFESFAEEPGGFHIAYEAVGSVAGLQQLAAGKVAMAASDIPPDASPASGQTSTEYFSTIAGGVVPIYNLPNAGRFLNLTPEVLADIYAGKIRKWNDARIRQWNRGARLPDAEIVVVHRADGSGTSYAWTSFLATASVDWRAKIGANVQWPIGTGVTGNEGIAESVAKTPNAIGYVELTYAIQHELSYAAVRNAAGRFIKADLDSITAAAAEAHDANLSILNAKAVNAYPIATFTYLVIPQNGGNGQNRTEIAAFLRWMLNAGQKQCSSLGYVPLPRETVTAELRKVDALK